jgi:hypothetical protein
MRMPTTIFLVLLVGIAGFLLGNTRLGKAWGKTPPEEHNAIVTCDVPRSWGQYRGAANGALAFEDSSGTVRIVDCTSHSPIVAFEIRRK